MQLSIAELSIRYFTNQMKIINAMAAENIMSVSEYIGWVVRGNLRVLPRVATLYAGMVRRVLAKSGRPDPAAEQAIREEHERRVAAVDQAFNLPAGTAAKVDAMRAPPVMRDLLATSRFLAIDLIAAGLVLVSAALAIVVWYPARLGLLAGVAGIALISLVTYIGALRFRHISEAAELYRTAERIAAIFNVPYVAFGHSHAAGSWPLRNGATYVNVGTWVPAGDDAYFVYFAITTNGAPQGRLWRWNKRKIEPEPFEQPPEQPVGLGSLQRS